MTSLGAGSNSQARDAGSLQHVRAALAEAEHRLDQLVGLAASSAEVQASLQESSQLGYFWGLFDSYAGHLQQQVSPQRFVLYIYSSWPEGMDLDVINPTSQKRRVASTWVKSEHCSGSYAAHTQQPVGAVGDDLTLHVV